MTTSHCVVDWQLAILTSVPAEFLQSSGIYVKLNVIVAVILSSLKDLLLHFLGSKCFYTY